MEKIKQKKIIEAVFSAIDEVNQLLPTAQRLKKSVNTALFDKSGKDGLDSLGLINFVIALEQEIVKKLKVTVALADERAMLQKINPFTTVKTLTVYIARLTEGDGS